VGEAVSGEVTVDTAMDNLAAEMDKVMARLERAKVCKIAGPKLNPKKDPSYWLNKPGAPKAKRNEKPQGKTVDYDELIKSWAQ
jgi:glycerol transport system substrate-binding protein